jgi:hypothetical protein
MRALQLPTHAFPVTYLVRFRVPRDSSAFVFALRRADGGPASGQDHFSTGDPIAGVLSRGREWSPTPVKAHLVDQNPADDRGPGP